MLRDKNLKKLCSGISKELSALNSVIDFFLMSEIKCLGLKQKLE